MVVTAPSRFPIQRVLAHSRDSDGSFNGNRLPFALWTEEPSTRPNRRKIRARIGGLHCSLCTGTIEKALGRMPGVDKVAVSLTHEQALVEYDPTIARPEHLLQTLRDIGYTISDPRKLRAFEEEEHDLVREARRFVLAVVLSVAAIPIIADPAVGWISFSRPWCASVSEGLYSWCCDQADCGPPSAPRWA